MIVKMKHLDLVCLKTEKEKTLEALRCLGAVHLDLASAQGATVAAAKGEGENAAKAVRLILKARGKTPREEIDIRERSVETVLALNVDRATLIEEKDRLEREIRVYEPYGDFDIALAKKVLAAVEALGDRTHLASSVGGSQDEWTNLVERAKEVIGLPEKLPEMRLAKMQEKLARVENRIRIDNDKLAGCDENAILKEYPALRDKIAFEEAKELMGENGELAYISGWVPVDKLSTINYQLSTNGCACLLREPAEGEMPPTLVEPPKIFAPMKALFAGLGIAPAYTEADVSVPFMCYFSLFFAMLVGDGAYGAIFLAATLWGWWKTRSASGAPRNPVVKSWLILLTVFSSATVVWGALSNTWFGAGLPFAAEWPTVKWLADPSYHNMMLLCFTIGVSHLMLARIWNGVCRLPDSTAIAEFGWAGILLFMYLVTNSIVGIFAGIPSWAFYVFGVAVVAVFGFTVKPSELKTRGAELGMLPLNIMSALGDIISYVRLFAVGLASVKVAENFNSMATGLISSEHAIWLNALMCIAMVAILVIGHLLNLAMAGLSILVHAVRLNTLEFSNHKGVSWAGYAFAPFEKSSK